MNREKLEVQLKRKEKARMTTFDKRKDTLFKKARELSILCNILYCVIIYVPKQDDGSFELDIGTQQPNEVRKIINKYKTSSYQPKIYPGTNYPGSKKRKIDDEIVQLRQHLGKDVEYPLWDDRIKNFSKRQLRKLVAQIDAKLEVVSRNINMKRRNHYVMKEGASEMEDDSQSSQTVSDFTKDYLHRKEDMEVTQQQSNLNVPPLDVQQPVYYHPQFNPDIVDSLMMKNYQNCTQFGVMPGNNIQYTTQSRMFNNVHPLMRYYMSTMQLMPPHMQYQTMPSTVPMMPPHMQYPMMPSAMHQIPPHYMQNMPPHMQYAPMSSASSHMHASPDDIHKFYTNNDNAGN